MPTRICGRRPRYCLLSEYLIEFSNRSLRRRTRKCAWPACWRPVFELTLPPADKPINPSLPLAPWSEDAIYKVRYFDEAVDLRTLGRAGHVHRGRALEGGQTHGRTRVALFSAPRAACRFERSSAAASGPFSVSPRRPAYRTADSRTAEDDRTRTRCGCGSEIARSRVGHRAVCGRCPRFGNRTSAGDGTARSFRHIRIRDKGARLASRAQ